MRRFRRPLALLAGLALFALQACTSFQSAGTRPDAPRERVRVEARGAPMTVRWRTASGAPAVADCPAESVEGLLESTSGDTLRFFSVLAVAQFGNGETTCRHQGAADVLLVRGSPVSVQVMRPSSTGMLGVLVVAAVVLFAITRAGSWGGAQSIRAR